MIHALILFAQLATPTELPTRGGGHVTSYPRTVEQDSLAKVNARWAEAGTTAAPEFVYVKVLVGPSRTPSAKALAAIAPHPGFYHCGTAGNFLYCPCANDPYVDWIDPETGHQGYWRYDYTPILYTGASACGLVPAPCIDGQGGPNHTQQAYGAPQNYLIPLEPQPDVNNYYPVPEAATGLGAIWAQFNTPPPTFPGTLYSSKMKSNPVFAAAWAYKRPMVQADPGCQGGAVTPTPSKTPTPVPTPTPAPNQFALQVEAVYRAGVMAGCGGGNFCPTRTLTRQELAAVVAKILSLQVETCHGTFADVACQ